MRKAINRLLRLWGYKIERISVFKRQLEQLAKTHTQLKFVQIGAHDGIRFDGLYEFVTQRRCRGIVVEPLPDVWERLRLNYADYPSIVPVKMAVHDSAKSMPLFRVSAQGLEQLPDWARGIASFNRQHLTQHGVPSRFILAEDVDCIPLMELLEEYKCLDADFMQIDVEGFDVAVIRMIDFRRFRPKLLKYEHKNASPEEQHAAVVLLQDAGYRLEKEGGDMVAWLPSR